MNAALKRWNENAKSDISQVVEDIKDFVKKQQHDIRKAFTEMSGPYEVKHTYKNQLSTDFWSLSPKERQSELKRISNLPLRVERTQNPDLAHMNMLKGKFPENQVEAMKVKVRRILRGNITQGFNGSKLSPE